MIMSRSRLIQCVCVMHITVLIMMPWSLFSDDEEPELEHIICTYRPSFSLISPDNTDYVTQFTGTAITILPERLPHTHTLCCGLCVWANVCRCTREDLNTKMNDLIRFQCDKESEDFLHPSKTQRVSVSVCVWWLNCTPVAHWDKRLCKNRFRIIVASLLFLCLFFLPSTIHTHTSIQPSHVGSA